MAFRPPRPGIVGIDTDLRRAAHSPSERIDLVRYIPLGIGRRIGWCMALIHEALRCGNPGLNGMLSSHSCSPSPKSTNPSTALERAGRDGRREARPGEHAANTPKDQFQEERSVVIRDGKVPTGTDG